MHRVLRAVSASFLAASVCCGAAAADQAGAVNPARAAAEPFRAALVRDIAEMSALLDALAVLRDALAGSGDPALAVDPEACAGGRALRAICAEMPESVR